MVILLQCREPNIVKVRAAKYIQRAGVARWAIFYHRLPFFPLGYPSTSRAPFPDLGGFMRRNRRAHLGACAAALLLFASPAFADTVEIKSGSATYYWDGSMTSFSLAAPDSNFVSEYFGQARSGFNGGESVDLSTTIPFTNAGNHPLAETLHNQQYQQVWLSGSITITAQPFLAPLANGDGSTFQDFTTSFKMSGTVSGFATRDHSGPPLFTATLIGGGTIGAGPYRIVGNQYALTGRGGESFTFAPTSWLPSGWLSRHR